MRRRLSRRPERIFASVLVCVVVLAGSTHGDPPALLKQYSFLREERVQRETFYLPRAARPPVVDGKLDDPAWQDAWTSDRFTWGNGRPGTHETRLFAAYDEENLYLAARCSVQDPSKLKALLPDTFRGGRAWGDDCVDFKISPDAERTVYQFIVAAGGGFYDAKQSIADWDPEWQRVARIGEREYVVEMAIPLKVVGMDPFQPGASMLMWFGRADRVANELTSLTEPYGELGVAPEFVLGTQADRARLRTAGRFTRDVSIHLFTDREDYPSFQKLATGRLRLLFGRGEALKNDPAIEIALWKGNDEIASQRIEPVESTQMDFDLPLEGIEPGAYVLEARLLDGREVVQRQRRDLPIRREQAPQSGRIAVTVPALPGERPAWPISFGAPFPWGALWSADHVQLVDAEGREIPIQAQVTGRWSKEGSIRWLLIDCLPPARPEPQELTLVYGPNVRREAVADGLTVEETDATVAMDTGAARFEIPRANTPGIARVFLPNGRQFFVPDKTAGPYMVDEAGTTYYGSLDPAVEVAVESRGPLKARVRVSGWHVSEQGDKLGKFVMRFTAWRGLPYVGVDHTFVITADTDKVRYRDIGYALPFRMESYFFGTPRIASGWLRAGDHAYLIQLDDRRCKIYRNGRLQDECSRAEGWVNAGVTGQRLTLAVKDFWQQFPKEIELAPDRATVHFWPAHGEEPTRTGDRLSLDNNYHQWFVHEGKILDFRVPEESLELLKTDTLEYNYPSAKVANAIGLAKSHEMLLYFHEEDWESARARTVSRIFQSNPTATCDPEWVCASGVFGNLAPRRPDRFPTIERALDETVANIFRHREMDRDYGMFNFGDSHHNWIWQERRWSMHRIWRNTHHGWTRWPWLMYARTGRKDLFDWADRNARHVADVDHCHYTTDDFAALPYPRGKIVGGICDYKGFVHWASGARLCYNSAADAMIHHYYFTGNERSRTAALEHGAALVADGKAQPHREGSGRCTSACALYFLTWDNAYLDFLERTADRLLATQREDGSFPQWENFAPYLQRYVDLTRSPRGREAMARWADAEVASRVPSRGYRSKINVLSHAYLYTGDDKYLRTAAYRVGEFVDNIYLGEDPRYRGQFIPFHSNLDQSYFMQEVPYYMAALAKYGREPERDYPDRTSIRALSREQVDGETRYVFHACLRQAKDAAFRVRLDLRGYASQDYVAEIAPVGGGAPIRQTGATPPHLNTVALELDVPEDGEVEYAVRIHSDKNFNCRVPITYEMEDVKEVYPIFKDGTWLGDGFRYYFNAPPGAEDLSLTYKGRAWPLKVELYDPSGHVVGRDVFIGSNDPRMADRTLSAEVNGGTEGWSFSVTGYGQANVLSFRVEPKERNRPFYFSLGRDKLFEPAE